MARETKAERLAREEREQQEYVAKRSAEYFPRLMAALERACDYGGTVVVCEGKFVLNFKYEEHALSPYYDAGAKYCWVDSVECVEAAVDEHENTLKEMRHREMLRTSALSKLTQEEADALGVTKY